MGKACWFAGGLLLGAGLAYLLDPDSGRRRRALVRDKSIHYRKELADITARTTRDLRNRAQGVVAETSASLQSAESR